MAAPNTPQDLIDRIRRMERQVKELTGRMNIRPALNTIVGGSITVKNGGDVRIEDGGSLVVETPDGVPVFATGQGVAGDWFVEIYRQDGSYALTVGDNTYEGDQVKQMVRMHSRSGNVIAMDDYYADGYLGRPWVPIPMSAPMVFSWSAWTPAFSGRCLMQHAVLYAYFSVYAPANTTAEARIMVWTNGGYQQMGPTIQSSNGQEAFFNERLTYEDHGMEWGHNRSLLIQVRRTAGTGSCTAWCQGIIGTNTLNESEAPLTG